MKAQIFIKLYQSQRLQRHLWYFIVQEEVNSVLWLPSKVCPNGGVGMHSLGQKPRAHTRKYRTTFTRIALPPGSQFPLNLSLVTNVGGDIQLLLKIPSTCKVEMPKSTDIYRVWSHLWSSLIESSGPAEKKDLAGVMHHAAKCTLFIWPWVDLGLGEEWNKRV